MPLKKMQRKGRPTLLSRLSTAQIATELQRRHAALPQLQAQRAALAQQIASLDAEIAVIEPNGSAPASAAAPKRRGRPAGTGRGSNKQSLAELLHSLLQGKTMSVGEMTEAAKRAGYKSTSKNFRMVVSLAILKNRKMFRKVARGQYTAT